MAGHRQWEYYVETVGTAFKGIGDEELTAFLNDLGLDGWEVFSVVQLENSVKNRVVAKRPVSHLMPRSKHGWP